MTLSEKQQIGQLAEQKACEYLQAKGFRLITQNYRCYFGEIDIVMQDQEDIVFIEVRSRADTLYGHALESIGVKKMRKLIKTAAHFLQAKRWLHKKPSRFDVITIHQNAGNMRLEWIKNAFTVDS